MRLTLSLISICLSIVTVARAAEDNLDSSVESASQGASEGLGVGRRLEFGFDIHQFDYAETLEAPKKSTEKGLMLAFGLGAWVKPARHSAFAHAGLSFSASGTHYDGSTQGIDKPVTPIQSETSDHILNTELLVGSPSLWLDKVDLRLYSGLGYRNWQRGSAFDSDTSLPETYHWFYLPVGLRGEVSVSDRLNLALDASARRSFGGGIDVHFADVSRVPDQSANLGGRTGWRYEASGLYALTRDFELLTALWYERSSIGQSNEFRFSEDGKSFVGHEPESRTIQYGASGRVAFKF